MIRNEGTADRISRLLVDPGPVLAAAIALRVRDPR
jgi:hypothetical protein